MTMFEYALARYARQKMTPDEAALAEELSQLEKDGHYGASEALEELVDNVLRRHKFRGLHAARSDHRRRPDPPGLAD